MKKIMYIVLMLGLCSQIHSMFRRTVSRATPQTTGVAAQEVASAATQKLSAKTSQSFMQATQARMMAAKQAAVAQKLAWSESFANAGTRMGKAMQDVVVPVVAAGVGGAVGGGAMYVHHKYTDKQELADSLSKQEKELFLSAEILKNPEQRNLWKSIYEQDYDRWLQTLLRQELIDEFVQTYERIMKIDDEKFREEQARKLPVKKFWGTSDSHNRAVQKALVKNNEEVKIHDKKQEELKKRLRRLKTNDFSDSLSSLDNATLIEDLKSVKPNLLLEERDRQLRARAASFYFPTARQTMADMIRPKIERQAPVKKPKESKPWRMPSIGMPSIGLSRVGWPKRGSASTPKDKKREDEPVVSLAEDDDYLYDRYGL